MSDVIRQVYDTSADIGRVTTRITSIILGIIIIGLVIGGIYYILKGGQSGYQRTTGVVQSSQCSQSNVCTIGVRYRPGSTGPIIVSLSSDRAYAPGSIIDLWFDPNDTRSVAFTDPPSNRSIGWILLGFALLLGIFVLINNYFVSNYKAVAALEGGRAVFDLIR